MDATPWTTPGVRFAATAASSQSSRRSRLGGQPRWCPSAESARRQSPIKKLPHLQDKGHYPALRMSNRAKSPGLVLDGDSMFATIDDWLTMTGRASPEVEAGSPLAGAARWSPDLQVAHAAWSAVTQAVDHLHALKSLVADARVVHTHAPFTLLRSATENAATAVWLLEPGARIERVRRRLKLAFHEARESGRAHDLMAAEAVAGIRTAKERMIEIQTLATAHRIDPNDVAGRFSYGAVVRQAGTVTDLGADFASLLGSRPTRLVRRMTHTCTVPQGGGGAKPARSYSAAAASTCSASGMAASPRSPTIAAANGRSA